MNLSRLPDSGTPGSMPACGSPRIIAACCALHHLLTPRHPLNALSSSLTILYTVKNPTRNPSQRLTFQRSISKTFFVFTIYGDERIRTADPLLAKQVLSQLSYTPSLYSLSLLWAYLDLNQRPHAYQACALTS
jgi:hypothetical protein